MGGASIIINVHFVLHNSNKDHLNWARVHFVFRVERSVKNRIFAGNSAHLLGKPI